jgi:tRNA(Arg) A34 adenosine deaminase TadA
MDMMKHAIELAEEAAQAGEVPVGAVITDKQGAILATAENRMRRDNNALAHAELLAIKTALEFTGQNRLTGCDLWVTLEPCAMCAGAIAHARLRRLYFAAYDEKGGAVDNGPCLFHQPTIHHNIEVFGGIQKSASEQLLTNFFVDKRGAAKG